MHIECVYIYIYTHICCGCHYLDQVWPFQGVIHWDKFAFVQTLLVKNTNMGFQHAFGERKVAPKILNWAKLAMFMLQQT